MRFLASLCSIPLFNLVFPVVAQAQLASKPEVRRLCEAAVEARNSDMLAMLREAIALAYPDNPKVLAYCAENRLSPLKLESRTSAPEQVSPPQQESAWTLKPWTGDLVLNAAVHRGNTVAATYGFRLDAERKSGSTINNIGATGALNRNNGVDEVDRWNAYFQRDHHIDSNAFAYWRIAFEKDVFADFDKRAFFGVGTGRRFVETTTLNLQAEVGPGVFVSEISESTGRELVVDAALFSALRANYQVNSHIKFKHDMEFNWSEPSSNLASVSSVKTAVTEQLSFGLSFEMRHQSNPEGERQPTDIALMTDIHFGY